VERSTSWCSQTLDAMIPIHGYRINRRIAQMAERLETVNQGTIYPALLRLEQCS